MKLNTLLPPKGSNLIVLPFYIKNQEKFWRCSVDELMKASLQQGLGYALFVFLLFYVLKEQAKRDTKSEEREKNYQGIISELTTKFEVINVKLDKVEDKIEEVLRK